MTISELLFWVAVAIPVYAFAGYPLALLSLRLLWQRPVHKAPITPYVSLLIPAFNEARVIARKIGNSLALDYPPSRLEIVVVSDGSLDETVSIARSIGGVRVLALPENIGKTAALNRAVPELRGEIIVFSDASAILAPDAVRRLVENFSDPSVGAVSGRYCVLKPGEVNIGAPEDIYWKYEAFVKTQESSVASTLGAHGHLYAIRRELYPFPTPETINDDYVIPLSVVARGFRVLHEPSARVFEEAREMTGFPRRVRIMAGNLQQLRYVSELLKPLQPAPLFFFLSHKAARLFIPFAMVAALSANFFLLGRPFYRALLGAQFFFYLLAGLGLTGRLRPRALRLPYYFCMVNSAGFAGLYHAFHGRRRLAWK